MITRFAFCGVPIALLAIAAGSSVASAQDVAGLSLSDVLPEGEGSASGRIVQLLAALTVLSLAPGLLIAVTSFVRFIIALSFLRAGLGLQSTPPNIVLIALALFMTFYVMGPTFDRAWVDGVKPLIENEIDEQTAIARISTPFEEFMLANTGEKELLLFANLSIEKGQGPVSAEKPPLSILIPAFMISELKRGFEIGFLIILPFLIIDIVVSILTMSMGMMMLPPTVVSLPFKILFFVLIDGWYLLVGSLVRSFA